MTYTYAQLSRARDLEYLASVASSTSHRALTSVSFRNAAQAHRDAADAYDTLVTGEPSQIAALASDLAKGRLLGHAMFELQALKAAGLMFNDCVTAFGTRDDPHLLAARDAYQEDGKLEFDEIAVVSLSEDGGAYVMAWQWVDTPGADA